MKLFKKILIAIAIVIAIPLVMAVFVKKEYLVERQITISKPRQEVFNYVRYLKNQDAFNPWILMDTDLKKRFEGTDGTIGFIYAWEGEKAGKGEQEIKKLSDGKRLDLELRFIKPFESTGAAWFATEEVSEIQTQLSWGMSGESPYPMNFMNLFMDTMLGKDLETGLNSLKSALENQ